MLRHYTRSFYNTLYENHCTHSVPWKNVLSLEHKRKRREKKKVAKKNWGKPYKYARSKSRNVNTEESKTPKAAAINDLHNATKRYMYKVA